MQPGSKTDSKRLLRLGALLLGPLGGALTVAGALVQPPGRFVLDSDLTRLGLVVAGIGAICFWWLRMRDTRLARTTPAAGASWPVLHQVRGGGNIPTGSLGRLNATWPLATLDLGEAKLRLRVNGLFMFGQHSFEAGPADVTAVYPVRGRFAASGVGFTDLRGCDYYFWTSQATATVILNGLAYYGYPVDWHPRRPRKVWSMRP